MEQVGTPRELYEEPVNEFVMGFVGEVNRIGDELVRPHDFEIMAAPNGSTQEGLIDRVVHLGFEVRVELTLDDGRSSVGADHPIARGGAGAGGRPDRVRAQGRRAAVRGHRRRGWPVARR